MTARASVRLLFVAILAAMLFVTTKASLVQPIWAWQGLDQANPDRWWTLATLADAYCGFLTFYAWVFYKETGPAARIGWLVAIALLGNLAMASYVLIELARLRDGAPVHHLLLRPEHR